MQNPGATLTELAVPSEVLGLDSLQRQALNSRYVRMVRVDDSRDPAKLLDHVPAGTEKAPELLLERVVSLLAWTQMR